MRALLIALLLTACTMNPEELEELTKRCEKAGMDWKVSFGRVTCFDKSGLTSIDAAKLKGE